MEEDKEFDFKLACYLLKKVHQKDIDMLAPIINAEARKDYAYIVRKLEGVRCYIDDLIKRLSNENTEVL